MTPVNEDKNNGRLEVDHNGIHVNIQDTMKDEEATELGFDTRDPN